MMDLNQLSAVLASLGYHTAVFQTKEEAASWLNSEIDGKTVGFGGSVTLQEMGLFDSLSRHNKVYSHGNMPEGGDPDEVRRLAQSAEVYLTSANALAETGEIVNIDGRGNRVGSTYIGHEKVYFIIGQNKISPDLSSAIHRARNVAAPKNARRLGCKTPCAVRADRCYDCNSPERICRGLSVFYRCLFASDTTVVLIAEDLGY